MSAFSEFICVAIALYLWESALWIPLRGIALRRRWSGKSWRALDPESIFATRESGVVPMWPLPADAGLAPCQVPPLLKGETGGYLAGGRSGLFYDIGEAAWDDLREEQHHLVAGNAKIRISSHRCIEVLRRARKRGMPLDEATRLAWRLALSPARAGREWRRWRKVSAPLRWYGPALAVGFFVGLPLAYMKLGGLQTAALALSLWLVMIWTSAHLWWLGKRVYPGARSAFRTDALLALFVPFHAMRAMEIAAAHAFGTTHPAGLILSTGDSANPWLAAFVRRILHPLPGDAADHAFSSVVRPLIEKSLGRAGMTLADFDVPPDRATDPEAGCYCPRCHGMFLAGVTSCQQCRGVALRDLSAPPAS